MSDYASFRQRLDAALRTLDINTVRQFLIAEGQWQEGAPADEEFAMWMMVAGSPTLGDLHERARRWLVEHGHEAEARAVLGKGKGTQGAAKQGQRARTQKAGQQSPRSSQSRGPHFSQPKVGPGQRKK